MEIFWRLVLGHLIADFTCQTNYIAAWKRTSLWGLFVHVTTHPVLYIALTWPYLNDVWFRMGPVALNGWACLAVIYVTHFAEDQWRIWSVMKHGAPDNLLFFLWDQAIHLVVIYALAPDSGETAALWPQIGALLVLATHFTTITVYFVEKDFFGRGFPSDRQKYLPMAARLLAFTALLLPGGLAWTAAAPVALQLPMTHGDEPLLTRTGFWLGNGLSLGAGLAARAIYWNI